MQNTNFENFDTKLVTNSNDYMSSFRQNIFTYLNGNELSLKDLSDISDVNYDTLKSFLYGNTKDCKISTAINLAKALNISIDELIGCETITPRLTKAIQAARKLPDKYIYFLCWTINYHLEQLKNLDDNSKIIDVMYPIQRGDGNITSSNMIKTVDISDMPDRIKQKTFFGVKVITEKYMPLYTPYDILLIANDRLPREDELCLIIKHGFMWLVYVRDGKYCSYKDEKVVDKMNSISEIIGYVCGTVVDKNK